MIKWFAYEYCSDVAATREFYRDLVGLELIWDEPDDIAFVHGSVQVSFRRDPSLKRPNGLAHQPGWAQGQLPDAPETQQVSSVSIALPPAEFRAAVDRLREAGVESLRAEPFWVGYWSFVALDPDGRTVELADPTSPKP